MASKGKKSRSKKKRKKGAKAAPQARKAAQENKGAGKPSKRSRKGGATEAAAPPTAADPEPLPDAAPVADAEAEAGRAPARSEAHDLDALLDDEPVPVEALVAAASALGEDRPEPADEHEPGEREPGGAPEAATATDEEDAAPVAVAFDDDDAIDLGETSTPETRARILAAALAHAEMQEARYRIPTATRSLARIKANIALSILAIAALVALVPPSLVVPEAPPALVEADLERGIRLALLLQAEQIESFRAGALRLPTSLEEAGAHVPGVRYVRSGNRLYQLVAYTADGRAIVYDSSAPAPEFEALEPSWRGSGAP